MLRNAVNPTQQFERFDDGNIPPELRALAEYHADCPDVVSALPPGNESVGNNFPGAGYQNSGEHLNGRGFSSAVRPDVADHFAGFNFKGNVVNGAYSLIFAYKKVLDAAPQSLAPL